MKKVCVKFVPKVLTSKQKDRRVKMLQELLDRVHDDPNFLENAITREESWNFLV